MFILVQCDTSLNKNYVAHSITVVCVIGWIWEKKSVCKLWLSVHTVWNQLWNKGFYTNSHLTTRRLKHSSNFESAENLRSSNVVEFEFEFRHIPIKKAWMWALTASSKVALFVWNSSTTHSKPASRKKTIFICKYEKYKNNDDGQSIVVHNASNNEATTNPSFPASDDI